MGNLMNLRAAAAKLGCHTETLRGWILKGVGPEHFKTPGGKYRFSDDQLLNWVNRKQEAR